MAYEKRNCKLTNWSKATPIQPPTKGYIPWSTAVTYACRQGWPARASLSSKDFGNGRSPAYAEIRCGRNANVGGNDGGWGFAPTLALRNRRMTTSGASYRGHEGAHRALPAVEVSHLATSRIDEHPAPSDLRML